MPEVVHRLKAAVRKLRGSGKELGLNGRIGVMGFSRGSNMAALLATTGDVKELEGDAGGAHAGVSSRVQAAMAHGARFDYTQLRADDPMLARFEKAWGTRDANAERWDRHGAAYYLKDGRNVAPMFLNTSNTEAPEFREGLAVFAARLKEAGVEHVYQEDADARGHRVSTDPETLSAVYAFFDKHLRD
jgi:acetyl esterase/lipase